MKRVCLIFQDKVAEHDMGPAHPLKKERLTLYLDKLRRDGLLELLGISVLSPQEEVAEEDILAVHDRSLLETIKGLSERGGTLDADTPVPKGTYERARLQAGGLLYGARAVMRGEFHRVVQTLAFGGHHAMRRHGPTTFGFCYFNQEAIVLRRLQREGYLKKALILDCDCHHGNGIQDIFYQDPSVLYISLHQDPSTLYPGIGFVHEIGEGPGRGYNVNVPLPPWTTCKSYLKALSTVFPPLAREFKPDVLLFIVTGDTHFKDPLTNLGLDLACYPLITKLVVEVANEVCGGRMIVQLGGGYDLKVATSANYAITACIAEYDNYALDDPYGSPGEEPASVTQAVEEVLSELKGVLANYWQCFRG